MHIGLLLSVPLIAAATFAITSQDPVRPITDDRLIPGKMDPALLQQLTWICGTWVQKKGNKIVEEHWRPLQGTTILGSSHTFNDKKTSFFEFLRIGHRAGSISYVANPGGGPPTLFRLVTLETGLMVFENPKHDHPQRISYEETDDGLTATISQLDGSRKMEWVFKKKE